MRLSTLVGKARDIWEASQVELAGNYSVERFTQLSAFSRDCSSLRVTFWCVFTPLPCILVLVLVDAVPLEPARKPPLASPVYWTRGFFATLLMSVSVLEQLRQHIPALHLTRRAVVGISLVASVSGVASSLLLSELIGHPLPFAMLVGGVPWITTIIGCVFWLAWPYMQKPTGGDLRKDLFAYAVFLQLRLTLVVIYPAYVFLFLSLRGYAQAAFVLVLALIKSFAKYLIAKAFQEYDDLKPEALIFNVEVFHALFVSYSMQNASSFGSILVLMAIDAAHAWLSIQDVRRLAKGLAHAAETLTTHQAQSSHPIPILELTSSIFERDSTVMSHPTIRVSTWVKHRQASLSDQPTRGPTLERLLRHVTTSLRLHQIAPLPPTGPKKESLRVAFSADASTVSDQPVDSPSLLVAKRTLQLLYVTEFIVLMEYVEIIVPVIFSTYMLAMFHLPNRACYPMLRDLSDDEIHRSIVNVGVYALLELVSLITVSFVLWRELRVSAPRQLAFVLEKSWTMVQFCLVMWVIYVVETTLEHTGFDYTFRFAWLRHRTP